MHWYRLLLVVHYNPLILNLQCGLTTSHTQSWSECWSNWTNFTELSCPDSVAPAVPKYIRCWCSPKEWTFFYNFAGPQINLRIIQNAWIHANKFLYLREGIESLFKIFRPTMTNFPKYQRRSRAKKRILSIFNSKGMASYLVKWWFVWSRCAIPTDPWQWTSLK